VVDEVEDTGTGATGLVLPPVPALGLPVPGLVLLFRAATDGGVGPQVTLMDATVIRSAEEEGLVVVVRLEGPVMISIALHALVPVPVLQFVVAEKGHFLPGDAHLAIPEAVMAVGAGPGVTRSVRVGHVRGQSLVRNRGLGPCLIQVVQGIHEARAVVSPPAEEGEQGAGAEAGMIFETAGQDRRGSCHTGFPSIVIQKMFVLHVLSICLYTFLKHLRHEL